jgi:hypothetical protein
VLAYIAWHRPADGVDRDAYERAVAHFHSSLAHSPPSGFAGSVAFRAPELPWLGAPRPDGQAQAGYEDWYLLDSWSAIGVLEEASVSHGHVRAHDEVASGTGVSTGAIYRLSEGNASPGEGRLSVWVTPARGHEHPSIEALLGDGMDPSTAGLWRRCIGLGPAPEYCLLATEPSAGVADSRLPEGWSATVSAREVLWNG